MKQICHGLNDQIAELISAVELGYWENNRVQYEKCKALFDLCAKNRHELLGYAALLYGRAYMIIGDLKSADEKFAYGIRLCRRSEDYQHLILGYLWQGMVHERLNNDLLAFKKWCLSLDYAVKIEKIDTAIEIYINLAAMYYRYGRKSEALYILNGCFSMAEIVDSRKLLAKVSIFLSDIYIEEQCYGEAYAVILRSELDVILHSDITWIVQVCKNKAICLSHNQNKEMALDCYQSGLAMAVKFEMAWANVDIALSYAELLIDLAQFEEANRVINEIESILYVFNDKKLELKWLHARYLCSKECGELKAALSYLKRHESLCKVLNNDHTFSSPSFEFSSFLIRQFKKLSRMFNSCERIVDATGIRMTSLKLKQFIDRCVQGVNSDRLIEIVVIAKDVKEIWQRSASVVNNYCSGQDIWIGVGYGHYYIYPHFNKLGLFDFLQSVSEAIRLQPWTQLGVEQVSVRGRILMVNNEIIDEVNTVLSRGFSHA